MIGVPTKKLLNSIMIVVCAEHGSRVPFAVASFLASSGVGKTEPHEETREAWEDLLEQRLAGMDLTSTPICLHERKRAPLRLEFLSTVDTLFEGPHVLSAFNTPSPDKVDALVPLPSVTSLRPPSRRRQQSGGTSPGSSLSSQSSNSSLSSVDSSDEGYNSGSRRRTDSQCTLTDELDDLRAEFTSENEVLPCVDEAYDVPFVEDGKRRVKCRGTTKPNISDWSGLHVWKPE